jgi:hypothetical protein
VVTEEVWAPLAAGCVCRAPCRSPAVDSGGDGQAGASAARPTRRRPPSTTAHRNWPSSGMGRLLQERAGRRREREEERLIICSPSSSETLSFQPRLQPPATPYALLLQPSFNSARARRHRSFGSARPRASYPSLTLLLLRPTPGADPPPVAPLTSQAQEWTEDNWQTSDPNGPYYRRPM